MTQPIPSPVISRRAAYGLPSPLRIGVVAALLIIASFGLRIGISAYRQNAAIRHLRKLDPEIRSDVSRIGPEWFRKWVGEAPLRPFGVVQGLNLSGLNVRNPDLAYIKQLRGLEWLALNRNPISDDGMRHLNEIYSLRALRLEDTRITDDGLAQLTGLKRLEVLSLKRTRVTGSGLKHLKAFVHLRHLDLEGNHIDDTALSDLKELKGINELRLGGTQISSAAIAELNTALSTRTHR